MTILKDVLHAHGIACEIRGVSLGIASGEIPPTEAWPELWVLDASRVEESRQLVAVALSPAEPDLPEWTCPKCRETLDGHFTTCWNCGFSVVPASLEESSDDPLPDAEALDPEEQAFAELEKAMKLETRGYLREARDAYAGVVERFGTTGAGKEAENALTVLEASIQPEEDSPDD